MKEWGLPMWDNEDAADEFATALTLMAETEEHGVASRAVVGIARCQPARCHSQDMDR